MKINIADIIEKTGAEVVADLIVVGVMKERKTIGFLDGNVFTLNEAGQEIAAQIADGTYVVKAPEEKLAEPAPVAPVATKASK
jgi:hypothetical protein